MGRLTPQQSVRRGLNVAGMSGEGLMVFEFKPSIGIAAAQIDKLGLDIRSFREPLKRAVQKVMAPSFRKNFEAEGRPDEWPEPSSYTLDIREKAGISGDLSLDRTGLLKKTVQQLNIWTITEKNATIQKMPEKVWYGTIQQVGHPEHARSGEIPARQFILVQEEDMDDIEEVFVEWLTDRAARSGGFKRGVGGRLG
jgi:phage virion morphogenesis protein